MPALMTKQVSNPIEQMAKDLDAIRTAQGREGQALLDAMREFYEKYRNTQSLGSVSEPIARLRALTEGWDGRDAEPLSETLLSKAECIWRLIDDVLPAGLPRPKVKAGRARFVSFSWFQKELRRELNIWVHEAEDNLAEWHYRSPEKSDDGFSNTSDELRGAVQLLFN